MIELLYNSMKERLYKKKQKFCYLMKNFVIWWKIIYLMEIICYLMEILCYLM